jgi:hypothetical protein
MLNIVTIGDMNVPLSSGIALGRAAGAVPFLVPEAASKYPALADYVTPSALYTELGGKTPHRILIEKHVMEGINRLQRHPPAPGTCGRNQVDFTEADVVCHPNCTPEDTTACLDDQICDNGRCKASPVSDGECAQFLYDVDVLDEGLAKYGEEELATPLRLARIAMPTDPDGIANVWAPRTAGKPYSDDATGWPADMRILGQLQAYIEPRGVHGFEPSTPCGSWDAGLYMINLIGRFFATSGADVYYLSHPESHNCLAKPFGKGACSFVQIP